MMILLAGSLSAQQITFDTPVKMGPSINSVGEEMNPWLAPDANTFYFSRAFDPQNVGGEFAGLDIWISTRTTGGIWTKATNKNYKWNNRESNAVIGVSADNNSVFLLNAYKSKDGIAFSRKVKGDWTAPEVIQIPGLTKNSFVGYYMKPSFDVLLISMNAKDSYGNEDLYVSLKDSTGKWSEPLNLGPTVNTEGFEIAPFLSEDGNHLYFSSNGHNGFGDADIYVSDRQYGDWGVWTKPRNLGSKINSSKFDSYFSLFGDSVCYFTSNRDSKYSDIYTSKVKITRSAQDSVNLIIAQTKKLLADLRTGNNATGLDAIEFIPFEKGSADLNDALRSQISEIIGRYDAQKVKIVEIGRYDERSKTNTLALERQRATISYVTSIGVSRKKIIAKGLNNDPYMPAKASGIEIRIYLYK